MAFIFKCQDVATVSNDFCDFSKSYEQVPAVLRVTNIYRYIGLNKSEWYFCGDSLNLPKWIKFLLWLYSSL